MRRFTKEEIITTDKYLKAFPNDYYKTDVIVNGTMFYWRDRTIYPPTHNLKMIISGHSDYPITDSLFDLYQPKKWFGTNKQTSNPNVYALPLGITNDTNESNLHPIYGNLVCMENVMDETISNQNLVYMNMSISTYPMERQLVWDLFKDKKWVTIGLIENSIEGRTRFLREIKSHSFVLCPRGNGMDTHRLWETLYMGSIPIVKKDVWNEEFRDLPICFINDWSDVTIELLEYEQNRIKNTNYNLDKLTISYWIDKIKSAF